MLLQADRVFKDFRTGFIGKCSPVHFFWGSFDLAVTRFSGRRAPLHPGGVPNLPDAVTREAYSHEVSSAGFWPGGGADRLSGVLLLRLSRAGRASPRRVRPASRVLSARARRVPPALRCGAATRPAGHHADGIPAETMRPRPTWRVGSGCAGMRIGRAAGAAYIRSKERGRSRRRRIARAKRAGRRSRCRRCRCCCAAWPCRIPASRRWCPRRRKA